MERNAAQVAVRSGKPLIPMIKADAYGLGAVEVARALVNQPVWAFGVATVAEAEELRAAGIDGRVLIFSPVLPWDFDTVRAAGAMPTLGAPDAISKWIDTGGGPWHLAIDTGMNRAGIEWNRVEAVTPLVARHAPDGAFTHFHSADANDGSMDEQHRRFFEALSRLPSRPKVVHAENSPAAERQSPSPWDVVRPGVFLYGVGGGVGSALTPEPVAHLRSRIVEIHEVPEGESVSYGATWRASRPSRIATLSIGYADGYRRHFSSRGHVVVSGRRAPVVGRVTMDMTMVDVTDVAASPGDQVTLLGRDGDEHLDVNVIGEDVGLLSYELLVGLRLRVPRIYVRS